MNKAVSVVSLLVLSVVAAGCGTQNAKARVHLRVFEVPTQVLRLHTSDEKPRKVADSEYTLSIVNPTDLDAMLRFQGANSHLLTDSTRTIDDWPAVADTWVYSPSYIGGRPDGFYSGGGVGSLGVREAWGHLDVRFDYMVDHRGPQGQKLIQSTLVYECRYPEGQVLLFHAPSKGADGIARQHVIAFEITRDNSTSSFGQSDRQGQPSDVLGYRR